MKLRFVAPIGMLAFAWLAVACSGSSSGTTGPLPQVAKAQATRDVTDGAGQQTTTITLNFDRPFEMANSHVPLASEFELQVPNPAKGSDATTRVLVAKADYVTGSRTITLHVNQLVADGAKLTIDNKTFKDGDTGANVVPVQSDMSSTAIILATVALTTQSDVILADPVTPPVTAADSDPVAQRNALKTHLETRGASSDTEAAALARYDAIPASIVPSPKVRAALAALTGTFAQPALDSLFTANNCTKQPVSQILIQPPPDAPTLLARVTYTVDGARIISLNPELAGDRIEHIMPFLAHESIHCDQNDSLTEEVVATSFDTFLYMELIASDPTIIQTNSPAGRELNVDVMAMLNSGRRLPESIGILPSVGIANALPGTTATVPSFGDLVVAAYPNVPNTQPVDEPLADAYVALLAPGAGMTPQPAFDVRFMDEMLGRLASAELITRVIAVLELTPA